MWLVFVASGCGLLAARWYNFFLLFLAKSHSCVVGVCLCVCMFGSVSVCVSWLLVVVC